jgi:hypothetical protein
MSKTPTTSEPPARAVFLAEHPAELKLDKAMIQQIRKSVPAFRAQLKLAVGHLIKSAEMGRQLGLAILAYEKTLPGGELTVDFWNQVGSQFIDTTGRPITREMMTWFVKIARKYSEPIQDVMDAFQCRQPLLLASGEPEFELVGQREGETAATPKNEWLELKGWIEGIDEQNQVLGRLRANANYFPGGHLNPETKELLAVQLRPQIKALDEIREFFRAELGF